MQIGETLFRMMLMLLVLFAYHAANDCAVQLKRIADILEKEKDETLSRKTI